MTEEQVEALNTAMRHVDEAFTEIGQVAAAAFAKVAEVVDAYAAEVREHIDRQATLRTDPLAGVRAFGVSMAEVNENVRRNARRG